MGSLTPRGSLTSHHIDASDVAFDQSESLGTPNKYLFGAQWSPNHSAHIKQSRRVHYRWHPFHGLDVRELRRERHQSGEFVRVEADPGEVALVAAWMLDPVACARLESGEPLVSLSALVELHYFLIESGFRKNSRQNMSSSREDTDDNHAPDTPAIE